MSYIVKVYSHKEDPAPYWNGNLFMDRWSRHQRDARRFDSLEQAKQCWSEVQPAISPSANVRFVRLKPKSAGHASDAPATDPGVLKLTHRGTDKVVAYACGKCRIVRKTREEAERCHVVCTAPHVCRQCGEHMPHQYWRPGDRCSTCRNKAHAAEWAAKEAARFEKAEKITVAEYGCDPLYCDSVGSSGDWGDHFFSDVDAIYDAVANDDVGRDPPEYAWACRPHPLTLDAEDIVYDAIERQDMHEDASDDVSKAALQEMQAFLDGWLARNPVVSWLQDNRRAVMLDQKILADIIAKRDGAEHDAEDAATAAALLSESPEALATDDLVPHEELRRQLGLDVTEGSS